MFTKDGENKKTDDQSNNGGRYKNYIEHFLGFNLARFIDAKLTTLLALFRHYGPIASSLLLTGILAMPTAKKT